MVQRDRTVVLGGALIVCLLVCSLMFVPAARAQNTQGTVIVTVLDPQGNVVQGAQLKLTDLATNDVRNVTTGDTGSYSFVGLNIGSYKLVITKEGFESQSHDVIVESARKTEVKAALKVGSASAVVDVQGSSAPLVETQSSATALTISTNQIENLPLIGRDITALSRLTPGYNGAWNGLPTMAEGNNIDGVISSTSRMKFRSNAQAIVSPRIENIAEMTVQTDQLDLDQGFGQANMQINFITRRGTNDYHGRVYEDFRNKSLNACPYVGCPKAPYILNEFGGSVGGPVIKDKLFFFVSYSMSKQPGSVQADNLYLTDAAQQGIYTYGSNTVNLFDLAAAYNASHPGANLPTSVNPVVAQQMANVNAAKANALLVPGDANNPNLGKMYWQQANATTMTFPTFRIDYNMSERFRHRLTFNETTSDAPAGNASYLPGDGQASGTKYKNFTTGYGFDWTITPTLINQFKFGFLYNHSWYSYNAADTYKTGSTVAWNYYGVDWPYGGNMSGQQFYTPIGTYYPVFNASDSINLIKGRHSMAFGFSFYREQDHYGNGPLGFPNYNLGLTNGDPALQAITAAGMPGANSEQLAEGQQLYAILAGRISDVNGQYAYDQKTGEYLKTIGAYNLNEVQKAWGLFFQDSFKLKPNLTLNYGLRWDFTGDNYDKTGAYHGATTAQVFGPTAPGDIFKPGVLNGDPNPVLSARAHQYQPWNVSPQPAIGIAWSPKQVGPGFWKKLVGNDELVIRAGYSLRRFTEPQQYFWNNASDYGQFFFQNFNLIANNTGNVGTFTPGSLALGDTLPAYNFSPTAYQASEPQSDFTFLGSVGVNGMKENIRQPYTQSWNVGIQRQLGDSTALEIRYNGNRTLHQWVSTNINEVNVFENGFLDEFKAAQSNLAINQANGVDSFADNGYAGQVALPILSQAFISSPGDFSNADYIQMLNTGQVGSLASVLTNVNYFCNLVSTSFTPCSPGGTAGYTGPGGPYPINIFQANPYASGAGVGYMTDFGYSNYNALQLDLRQRMWHGVQFDANYTWSHSLGVAESGDWTGGLPLYTNRDIRRSYAPTAYDLRHVVHVNASYDLPFGKGREFLNSNAVVDKVLGGWTVSTVFQFRTGAPFRLTGGGMTFNDYGDGGIVLNGLTASEMQSAVGVYHQDGKIYFLDPSKIAGFQSKISANTTPGTIGQTVYLYGPHQTLTDMGLTKSIPITERIHFKFQSVFMNAFNHPIFRVSGTSDGAPGSQNATSSTFGRASVVNNQVYGAITTRRIEFRANIEF